MTYGSNSEIQVMTYYSNYEKQIITYGSNSGEYHIVLLYD
jgi:hypothetical protein